MGGNGPIRRTVKIVNPLGLHQRPATAFALTAKTFASRVSVSYGGSQADGKNLIDLILLVALPEAEVVLEVDGPDAEEAVEPLARILASPGDDEGPPTLRLQRPAGT